jgi:WhiB family redox-sensing transcriptional regulator
MVFVGPRPLKGTSERTLIPFPYSEEPTRCSTDPDLFNHEYDSAPRRETEEKLRRARQACSGCVLVNSCLKWALANPDLTPTGVWAATTARERKALRDRLVGRLGPDWVSIVAAEDRRMTRRLSSPHSSSTRQHDRRIALAGKDLAAEAPAA